MISHFLGQATNEPGLVGNDTCKAARSNWLAIINAIWNHGSTCDLKHSSDYTPFYS